MHSKKEVGRIVRANAAKVTRRQQLDAALSPSLHGIRAAAWLPIWDKGLKASRVHLLEAFLILHSENNISAMEADLGDAAPLLFTRFTSWLRLTYKMLEKKPAGGSGSSGDGGFLKSVAPAAAAAAAVAAAADKTTAGVANATQTSPGARLEALIAQREDARTVAEAKVSVRDGDTRRSEGTVGKKDTKPESAAAAAASTGINEAPTPLLLLVRALTVFVRGASYLTQLVEAGVAGALTDCLECGSVAHPLSCIVNGGGKNRVTYGSSASAAAVPNSNGNAVGAGVLGGGTAAPSTCLSGGGGAGAGSDEVVYRLLTGQERRAILTLLIFMSNAGRVYREMICEEQGLTALFHTMQRETIPELSALMTELFLVLGQGNPRVAALVYAGLVRVIMCYPDAIERGVFGSRGVSSPPSKEVASALGSGSDVLQATVSEEVVLQAARALRGLQLAKEAHHYSNHHDDALVDQVPIVGLAGSGGATVGSIVQSSTPGSFLVDPLLRETSKEEFLDTLFYLTLHECNTRFRVEGNELLTLVAKNIQLTRSILVRCLDALDDDLFLIADEDDTVAMTLRQRRQMSCGRTAVQILLSRPMTPERMNVIMQLIALRSAHMTILKYLRMTDNGDTAAVLDCCKVLQLIARASDEQQRAQLQHNLSSANGATTVASALLKIGHTIRDTVGSSLYQVLLFQDITEEEGFAILRAARAMASAGSMTLR